MNIHLQDGLPFVEVTLDHQGQRLVLSRVLLDTGSAGSLLAADDLLKINVSLEPRDPLRRIRGVGGGRMGLPLAYVFARHGASVTVCDINPALVRSDCSDCRLG